MIDFMMNTLIKILLDLKRIFKSNIFLLFLSTSERKCLFSKNNIFAKNKFNICK